MEELIPLIEFYKRKVERNPQLLSAHAVLSEYLILYGNYDEAALISLKSLLVSPAFIRSQIDLAISYLMKNDLKSSEIELKHALKIDPENDFVLFLLGLIYFILGVYDISLNYLEEGFDYNPKNIYIRRLYTMITNKDLPDMSNFKEIETKVYNGFISSSEMKKIKEKNNKKPYELLYAYTLKNEDRLLEAIEEVERILIYHPYYPKALFILGKFNEMAGNRRKKDECWEKCYEVDPLNDFVKGFGANYENYHFDKKDFEDLIILKDNIYQKIFSTFVKKERLLEEYKIPEIKKEVEIPKVDIEEIITEEEKIKEKELLETKKEILEGKEKEEVILKEEYKEEELKDKDYYKKLGDEYLKKGMYKEAIEMFTKALNLSKERR